jgi:DGQHR domain-containing protein
MAYLTGIVQIELMALKNKNLDTDCFRGAAPLAHLALISQPDVYDQINNPDGLQRDLSPSHASKAYEYANRAIDDKYPRAFPEIILNVRDKKIVEIEEIQEAQHFFPPNTKLYRLRFQLDSLEKSNKVKISRVDGNHRLYYAAGDKIRDPILALAPFQLHIGLSKDQERALFLDINANQKGLNTSHLSIMRGMLTPEQEKIKHELDQWIAEKLSNDPESPWHGLIHMGGSKKGSRTQGLTRPTNFVSLKNGVKRTISKSQYLRDLTSPEAQYVIIRNYWTAVKKVFAQEWASAKEHMLLKNIGVLSMSILAGAILDRCMPRGKVDVEDMVYYLEQAKTRFDWSVSAEPGDRSVKGMSGTQAAMIIAGEMASELHDESGENLMKQLQEKLLTQTQATVQEGVSV